MSMDKGKSEIKNFLGSEDADCMDRRSRRSDTSAGENIHTPVTANSRFLLKTACPQVHNLSMPDVHPGREVTPLDYCHGNETILVVDDEESLRIVIGDLLTQLGYHVLSTANGPDALALAGEYAGKIDLLLTDVMMDPLSGPALAEALTSSRPDMKVVFISGYATPTLAPDGTLKPGTVLVHKPFTMKLLSAKLREVLESAAPV